MVVREPSPFRAADGSGEPEYKLVRLDAKTYELTSRFSYIEPVKDRPVPVGRADEHGAMDGERCFVVPRDGLAGLCTDMASVPPFLAWLVPKDGSHTPAAFLHDALMPHEPRLYGGPEVDRVEADRIFRLAMGHLGVAFLRRWAMWGAVSVATFAGPRPKSASRLGPLLRELLTGLVALVVGTLGLCAWADLFDVPVTTPLLGVDFAGWRLALPRIHEGLPGMRERAWTGEAMGLVAWLCLVTAVTGVGAAAVRLASEAVRPRRSWLRALTFVVLAASLMLFAVPMLVAAVGWAAYFPLEALAAVILWALRGIVRFIAARSGPGVSSPVDRFDRPINPPRLLRR